MKFVSFRHEHKDGFGLLTEQGVVDIGRRLNLSNMGEALLQHGWDGLRNEAARHSADFSQDQIQAYRPVVADAGKIFCVGLNYDEHVRETNRQRTERPTIFLRLAGSQIGHEQPMLIPRESPRLDYEGEIAVVVGRGGRRIPEHKALEHLAGYACYNDGSVRDWQTHTSQWTPGKNFFATGAFGPWLVDADEVGQAEKLQIETRLNGEVMQSADTSMLIFSIPELVAYVSTFIDLVPGDVIVTGTPGGVGAKRQPPVFMKHGDVVEVSVSKLGVLRNSVEAE